MINTLLLEEIEAIREGQLRMFGVELQDMVKLLCKGTDYF